MSEIITQGRRLSDLGVALIKAIEAAVGNDDDARCIFKDEKLCLQIGQLVMGKLKLVRPKGFSVTYNQSLGLRKLIKQAVGKNNLGNISSDITAKRFPLKGTDTRTIKCQVVPFFGDESGKKAAKRLTAAGYKLANTGDLAGFFHDHPEEIQKWFWVVALSEESRWTDPDGRVYVPCALADDAYRDFFLDCFHDRFHPASGVLVLCE